MQPIIKTVPAKKLIGKKTTMSLADNKTFALFSDFMPKRLGERAHVRKLAPHQTHASLHWSAADAAGVQADP